MMTEQKSKINFFDGSEWAVHSQETSAEIPENNKTFTGNSVNEVSEGLGSIYDATHEALKDGWL